MDLDSIVLRHINSSALHVLNEAEGQKSNNSRFVDDLTYSQYLSDVISNREAVLQNYNNRHVLACRSELERLNRNSTSAAASSHEVIVPERLAWNPVRTCAFTSAL